MYSSSFPKYSMFTSPHRVSHLTFILYSPDLLYKVTYIFWALTCLVALPTHTALISSFCTSSQNFDTHFLHFHLTMDSLCFSMWLAISTSTTDFHRLAKRHACRTKIKSHKGDFFIFHFIYLTKEILYENYYFKEKTFTYYWFTILFNLLCLSFFLSSIFYGC